MSTHLGSCLSQFMDFELRRLTMRRLHLSIILVACMLAADASYSVNNRRRRPGRCAGKGPGLGLRSAKKMQVLGERLLDMQYSVPAGALMQQPADRIVRRHPAVELLPHALRGLAAQNPATLPEMGLGFVEHPLGMQALVVQRHQFLCRRGLFVQQRGKQPIARLSIGQAGQRASGDPDLDRLRPGLLKGDAGGADLTEEGVVVQFLQHRKGPVFDASPQQARPGMAGLSPVLEPGEAAVGQAQHMLASMRPSSGPHTCHSGVGYLSRLAARMAWVVHSTSTAHGACG
jgi:hypothetical protein